MKDPNLELESIAQDHSSAELRLKSLEGCPFAFELAQVGGCFNASKKGLKVLCYKCGLSLPWREINELSESLGMPFLKAAWLFHADFHPYCDFLRDKKGKCITSCR